MACHTDESMKVTSTEKELSTKTERQKTAERVRMSGLSFSWATVLSMFSKEPWSRPGM